MTYVPELGGGLPKIRTPTHIGMGLTENRHTDREDKLKPTSKVADIQADNIK